MYKRGFTLAEILITLGVVGIIAVLTVPSCMNFMPSEQKIKYIKAHNTLLKVTEELLSDPSLYYTTYNNAGTPNCQGFNCTTVPLDGNHAGIQGRTKLGLLMAEKMQLISGPSVANNRVSFTSADNTGWNVRYQSSGSTVTIDIDPENSESYCRGTFSNACKNPDQFTFLISNSGNVTPTDALGAAFLSASSKLTKAQADQDVTVAENKIKSTVDPTPTIGIEPTPTIGNEPTPTLVIDPSSTPGASPMPT